MTHEAVALGDLSGPRGIPLLGTCPNSLAVRSCPGARTVVRPLRADVPGPVGANARGGDRWRSGGRNRSAATARRVTDVRQYTLDVTTWPATGHDLTSLERTGDAPRPRRPGTFSPDLTDQCGSAIASLVANSVNWEKVSGIRSSPPPVVASVNWDLDAIPTTEPSSR